MCSHPGNNEFLSWRCSAGVESLLLDFGCFPLPSADECQEHRETCCLDWITSRVAVMCDLKVLRLPVSSFHVEKLLIGDRWLSILQRCYQLHEIVIDLLNNHIGEAALERAATIGIVFSNEVWLNLLSSITYKTDLFHTLHVALSDSKSDDR